MMNAEGPLSVSVAALFLYSASFKILDTQPVSDMIRSLGASDTIARVTGRGLPGYELATALALLADVRVGAVLSVLAGAAMILVGMVAITSGRSIKCACFSSSSIRTLGVRQVALGFAIAGTSLVILAAAVAPKPDSVLLRIAIASLAVVGLHIVAGFAGYRKLVRYRVAASPEFPA